METVPEQKELKQQIFKDLEAHVGEDVILASNTSGIPISDLASVTRVPSRVVGMHWSNPPHLIPVIEVIRGERTSDETAQRTVELVEKIGQSRPGLEPGSGESIEVPFVGHAIRPSEATGTASASTAARSARVA